MKNRELIEKINDKLKDKLDENINILDFVSFIKTLKLTNMKKCHKTFLFLIV